MFASDLADNKLQVHCNKCEVGGRVDADFNANILNPPESEFKISFAETKGHIDMTVAVGSGAEQVIPLWNTQGVPTDVSLAKGRKLCPELTVCRKLKALHSSSSWWFRWTVSWRLLAALSSPSQKDLGFRLT
jgi:hypothetical protein